MSIDRTLRMHGELSGARSVLTRDERIARLIDDGKFDPETGNPFGLPKVRVRTSKAGTKSKKEAAPEAEAVEGAEGAESAEGAPAEAAADDTQK